MRIRSSMKYLLATAVAVAAADMAYADTPSTSMLTAPIVDQATAATAYAAAPGFSTHTFGAAAWSAAPADMQELARSLGAELVPSTLSSTDYATRVSEYVRNNIDVEFRYGLGKGARGAVIDQSGTPFDQAQLMVELLQRAGVASNYKVGTITLTAQQFGQWTGVVTGLAQADPPALPTFTVYAQAACQFLADGGIPATVTGSAHVSTSGGCAAFTATETLSSVQMGHIWVDVGGNLFDPSFKRFNLRQGIDIAQRMGCGTDASPTCGSSAVTATMTGAVTGTLSGASTIKTLNESQLTTSLSTYATTLQTYVEANLGDAPLEEVIGGRLIDDTYVPAVSSTLPYSSSVQWTWSVAAGSQFGAGIPDAFRTTLRVQVSGIDQTMYADELAGRRLEIALTTNLDGNWVTALQVDDAAVASNVAYPTAPAVLSVDHPYITNSRAYGDESVSMAVVGDYVSEVVFSLGNTGEGRPRYFGDREHAALQNQYLELNLSLPELRGGTGGTTLGAQFLYHDTLAARMVEGVSKTRITQHHSIGLAATDPRSTITLDAQVSINSSANVTALKTAAFEDLAVTNAMIEGSMLQQQQDTWLPSSAVSYISIDNSRNVLFLDLNSTSFSALNSTLSTYFTPGEMTALSALISSGYNIVLPEVSSTDNTGYAITGGRYYTSGNGRLAYKTGSLAWLLNGTLKGGSAAPGIDDPLKDTLDAVKPGQYGLRSRKGAAVSMSTGDLALTATPDIVTGVGGFPAALPLQRTYQSSNTYSERIPAPWSNTGYYYPDGYFSPGKGYYGSDSRSFARLGEGWTHNYQITASLGNDGAIGLGSDRGIDALAAIAALYTIGDLSRTPSLSGRLTAALSAHWLSKQFMTNVAQVEKLPGVTRFVRLPNGAYKAPPGSQDKFTFTAGTKTGPLCANCAGAGEPIVREPKTAYDYGTLRLAYTDGSGSTIAFSPSEQNVISAGTIWTSNFVADSWTFPTGVVVSFQYQSSDPGTANPQRRYLSSVSNNLGRSLTFTVVAQDPAASLFPGSPQDRVITRVTDETGRFVSYERNCTSSGSGVEDLAGPWSMGPYDCRTFEVVLPDSTASVPRRIIYGYVPTTGSPQTSSVGRAGYRLRTWFTPDDLTTPFMTFDYDTLYRVKGIVDKAGARTNYFVSGMYGGENRRRGDTQDAVGAFATQYFDKYQQLLSSTDGLGRTSWRRYDDHRRLKFDISPEGNSTEYAYDVRSNVTSEIRHPKTNSAAPNRTTIYTYKEAATVGACSVQATCNKVTSITDPKGNVATYDYYPDGQLKQVKGPVVSVSGTNSNAETDLCYTSTPVASGSVNFLTGKVERIDTSRTRVVKYAYNSSNKYVLNTATTDPTSSLDLLCQATTKSGALNLTNTITFDAVGNVASVDGPRTDVTDVTDFNFDAARRLTRVVAPAVSVSGVSMRPVTRYTYFLDGSAQTIRHSLVASPTDGNPSNPWPTDLVAAQWQTETRTYTAVGDLQSVTDAEGNVTQFTRDALGRAALAKDPDGRRVATVYDLAGQTRCTWKGWDTDSLPNIWTSANPAPCNWTPGSYPSDGHGKARYAAYDYTLNGKQKTLADADNNTTELVYDSHDRLRYTLFPNASDGTRCTIAALPAGVESGTPTCAASNGKTPTYEDLWYTTDGTPSGSLCNGGDQACRKRQRNGQTIANTYDAQNRLLTKAASDAPVVTYGYDLLNTPLSASTPSGTVNGNAVPAHSLSYSYDDIARKTSETLDSRQVSYGYTGAGGQAGGRTSTTWPDGYSTSYEYDALNRMSVAWEGAPGATRLADYSYDVLSRRAKLQYANTANNRIDYTYEPDNNLDVLTNVLASTTVTLDQDHNHSGQITAITASDTFYLPQNPMAIGVSWTPATDDTGVTQYVVERCAGTGCSTFSPVATVTGTSYVDTEVVGTVYSYRVKAQDGASHSSGYSSVVTTGTASSDTQAPSAATGLSATASGTQINLSWTAATDNVGVTNYLIERCQGASCANFLQLAAVSGSTTSYSNTGLAASTSYSYRVRAIDAANNLGAPTSNASATTAGGGSATIAYVQGAFNTPETGGPTFTVTYPSAQQAGDLNVVIVAWYDTTSTLVSVTDSAGNTYTKAVGPTVATGFDTQYIYYAKNIVASPSNTITVTYSNSVLFPDVRIAEYSGVDTVSPLDGTVAAQGTGTALDSGSLTTTNANDLLVAGNELGSQTTAIGSTYTQRQYTGDLTVLMDKVVSATGSYNATSTQSDSAWWLMQLAAFKAAGTGGGGGTDTQSPTAPTNLKVFSQPNQGYAVNALNQYSGVNGFSLSYDDNGNLTSWTSSAGTRTFTYDSENRLRTATVVGGGTTTNVIYDYDPIGRRVSKSVNGTVTQYLLDGDEEIAELDGAGTVLRRYIMGPGTDDRIARAEGSATSSPAKFYYHVNHQGSVIDMTDSTGTITQQLAYDEYGNLTSQQPPASVTGEQFRYAGRRFDPETGLYYYRARYYSPQLGRFLQTDPVGYADDVDLYAYVGNDSLNKSDPTGLAEKSCTLVLGSHIPVCSSSQDGTSNQSDADKQKQKQNQQTASTAAVVGAAVGATVAAAASVPADVATAGANVALTPEEVALGAAAGAVAGPVVQAKAEDAVDGIKQAQMQMQFLLALLSIHANSYASTRPTSVYQLVSNRTGAVLKYGITSDPSPQSRYPSYFYTIGNFRMQVLATYPTRSQARSDEVARCIGYTIVNGHLPPLSITC